MLKIANQTDPEDYLNLTLVSGGINDCLTYRSYQLNDAKRKLLKKEGKSLKEKITKILKRDLVRLEKGEINLEDLTYAPPREFQLVAVRKDGYELQSIKDPSEDVILEAIKENGCSIRFVKNPSEKLQIAAINKSSDSIQCIEKPSEKVQLLAVRKKRKIN